MELVDYGTANEETRDQWIVSKLSGLAEGSALLDAGAGNQKYRECCKHLKYTSQDFAKYDGKGNSTGLQTDIYDYGNLDIISDITRIPRPNKSFDAILCSEVLEHVVNPILVIKELSRLLKSDGKLILTAPFCSLTHFAPYHYTTGFNRYWYEYIFPVYDLQITNISTYGNYFQYLAQEIHRLHYIINTYSEKDKYTVKEINALNTVLEMLVEADEPDNSSWQLLNYGFLVEATKI
jgi:SAM-dependent methyltransferase